jgi:hypothetical protein
MVAQRNHQNANTLKAPKTRSCGHHRFILVSNFERFMSTILQLLGGIGSAKVFRRNSFAVHLIFPSVIFLPTAHAADRVALLIGSTVYANAVPLHASRKDFNQSVAVADPSKKREPSTQQDERIWKDLSEPPIDLARTRIDTSENPNRPKQRVTQYTEKEIQPQLDWGQTETDFRKAVEELGRMRQRSERRRPDGQKRVSSAVATQPVETGRLPPTEPEAKFTSEAKRVTKQTRQKSTFNCQEINARVQIGDISETDRAALQHCH